MNNRQWWLLMQLLCSLIWPAIGLFGFLYVLHISLGYSLLAAFVLAVLQTEAPKLLLRYSANPPLFGDNSLSSSHLDTEIGQRIARGQQFDIHFFNVLLMMASGIFYFFLRDQPLFFYLCWVLGAGWLGYGFWLIFKFRTRKLPADFWETTPEPQNEVTRP